MAYYVPVYFDNVRVWHIDGADETLLYENFFTSRTVYSQDKRVASLVGTLQLNPEGQDGWTRVDTDTTSVFATDGAKPSLGFGRNPNAYAVHDIGQKVSCGTIVAQADICPPRGWLDVSGSVYVRLGGDAHIMGNIHGNDASYYLKNIAAGFGFKEFGGGMLDNLYTNATTGRGIRRVLAFRERMSHVRDSSHLV